MRTTYFSSLLFACLASFSVATLAAEVKKIETTKPATTQSIGGTEKVQEAQTKVNLNTADSAILQEALIGIGAVKAQAIVEYREAHGPFASVDELLEVKGIGAATLEKNRDRLSVN